MEAPVEVKAGESILMDVQVSSATQVALAASQDNTAAVSKSPAQVNQQTNNSQHVQSKPL